MIDFEVWFSQIVTTSELVASDDAMERAWVAGEEGITSIRDFFELYEQVFEDLDSEACLAEFSVAAKMDRETQAAVAKFLDAAKGVDSVVTDDPVLLRNLSLLLLHPSWRELKDSATVVTTLPSARAYRSGRVDILPGAGERGEADLRLWGDRSTPVPPNKK